MKRKTYAEPSFHSFPACGHAVFSVRLPAKDDAMFEDTARALCRKIQTWLDEGTLEDQIEFVADPELSFAEAQGEEAPTTNCIQGDAPFDMLDYDEVSAAGVGASFFGAG